MDEISTVTPYFGGGGFNGAIADVGRQPEIAMAAYKPEAVITQERYEISARFQRILGIFDHAQHAEVIANIVIYRPTSDR